MSSTSSWTATNPSRPKHFPLADICIHPSVYLTRKLTSVGSFGYNMHARSRSPDELPIISTTTSLPFVGQNSDRIQSHLK